MSTCQMFISAQTRSFTETSRTTRAGWKTKWKKKRHKSTSLPHEQTTRTCRQKARWYGAWHSGGSCTRRVNQSRLLWRGDVVRQSEVCWCAFMWGMLYPHMLVSWKQKWWCASCYHEILKWFMVRMKLLMRSWPTFKSKSRVVITGQWQEEYRTTCNII